MKILHVIDQLSQFTAGGSAKVCYQMAEQQAKLGHKVTIYTSDAGLKNFTPPVNVKVKAFHCALNFLGGIKITPGMLFTSYNYDVIHLHNYRTFVNLMAAGNRKPWILQAHGSAHEATGRFKSAMNFIWQPVLKNASCCIADAPAEVWQYYLENAELKKIAVIPVGIDLNEFKDLPPKVNDGKKRILFLGRLHPLKGIDLLIDAFRRLSSREVILQIAGNNDGWFNDSLASRRIELLGPLYGSDKLQAYVNADVFVLPSQYEMWGLTFMEALACGTPVVMTDRCEASKVLPEECGLVSSFEPDILAYQITKALETKYNSEVLKEWVSQYGWDNIIPKIIKVYEGVK